MAKKSGNKQSAEELKQQMARSREEITHRLSRVREEADLPRRIRRSVQREPVPWIIGAIAVGLLVTAVVTRKKKVYVDAKGGAKTKHPLLEAGFVLGALRIAATLFKPMILKFVEEKFGHYSARGRPGSKGF
jgi:hypothetical protein